MTHPTLSLKGLAIDVNCSVNTQTDKPLCLPEKANSINLFERFFRSLDTAQSSRMIKVFVPENNTVQRFNNSSISASKPRNVYHSLQIHDMFYFDHMWGKSK